MEEAEKGASMDVCNAYGAPIDTASVCTSALPLLVCCCGVIRTTYGGAVVMWR